MSSSSSFVYHSPNTRTLSPTRISTEDAPKCVEWGAVLLGVELYNVDHQSTLLVAIDEALANLRIQGACVNALNLYLK